MGRDGSIYAVARGDRVLKLIQSIILMALSAVSSRTIVGVGVGLTLTWELIVASIGHLLPVVL